MKIKISIFLAFFALLYSCSEESILKPYGENDGVPPGEVTLSSYQEIPGGVILKYVAPKDEDLMYVKAEYTLDTGTKREMRSSVYSDTIKIEGFGNTNEKNIRLTAVDRYENMGQSVDIKVVPGEAPLHKSFKTIISRETWGGVEFRMENKDKANLIMDVMALNSEGEWYPVHTEYSDETNLKFSVRGFLNVPHEFKLSIRDQWDNKTDIYTTEVTPLYEEPMDRDKFREFYLGNDTRVDAYGFSMSRIWNGRNDWGAFNMCHSNNFEDFPVWFTFDMGVKAKLSRGQYWQRLEDGMIYGHGNMDRWEIWGHPDTPPLDGSWDGWIKLLECEDVKPSGLPGGTATSADIAAARKGVEYDFDTSSPPVRYLRIKALSTFSGMKVIHIQQMWFWGQVIE